MLSKLSIFVFLMLSSKLMSAASLQANINVNAGAASGQVVSNEILSNANSIDSLVRFGNPSFSLASRRGTASYAARASFANLGASFDLLAVYESSAGGSFNNSGSISVASSDRFLVQGTTNGFVKVDFLLEGGISLQTASPSLPPFNDILSSYSINPGVSSGTLLSASFQLKKINGEAVPTISLQEGPNTRLVPGIASSVDSLSTLLGGSVLIPITNGQAILNQFLSVAGGCFANNIFNSCSLSGDYFNSAKVGGAVVYDQNMNLVPNAVLVADSGYDYTTPLSNSAVPEPGTFALLGFCLIAGSIARFVRHQRILN